MIFYFFIFFKVEYRYRLKFSKYLLEVIDLLLGDIFYYFIILFIVFLLLFFIFYKIRRVDIINYLRKRKIKLLSFW